MFQGQDGFSSADINQVWVFQVLLFILLKLISNHSFCYKDDITFSCLYLFWLYVLYDWPKFSIFKHL